MSAVHIGPSSDRDDRDAVRRRWRRLRAVRDWTVPAWLAILIAVLLVAAHVPKSSVQTALICALMVVGLTAQILAVAVGNRCPRCGRTGLRDIVWRRRWTDDCPCGALLGGPRSRPSTVVAWALGIVFAGVLAAQLRR